MQNLQVKAEKTFWWKYMLKSHLFEELICLKENWKS